MKNFVVTASTKGGISHIGGGYIRGKNEACQYVVGLKMTDCFGFQSVRVE